VYVKAHMLQSWLTRKIVTPEITKLHKRKTMNPYYQSIQREQLMHSILRKLITDSDTNSDGADYKGHICYTVKSVVTSTTKKGHQDWVHHYEWGHSWGQREIPFSLAALFCICCGEYSHFRLLRSYF
jgi:hypothetical protein